MRSWLRQVQALADVEDRGGHVRITAIQGALAEEEPSFSVRVLDYLLRSHAMGTVYPAPLPAELAGDPAAAALWCMAQFGNQAWFATPHQVPWSEPDRPLRTHSLLHIAVARGRCRCRRGLPDSGHSRGPPGRRRPLSTALGPGAG